MDGSGGITKHLFVNGKVDCITDCDLTSTGLLPQSGNVVVDGLHLIGTDGTCVDLISECGRRLQVVIGIRGIGVLELLGQLDGRHGRFIGKLHSSLNLCQNFLPGSLQFILSKSSVFDELVLEEFQRILFIPGPLLLTLTTTLVLRISGRVSIKAVGVHLHDGRSSGTNVVHDSLSSLGDISSIRSVHQNTRDAVVLTLLVHITVGGNIGCESVDGTSVINDNDQQRQVVLGGSVEDFCHTTVLGSTLSDKHD
mmetsp:Transcript_21693/g.32386  ORF Transcript_21693/g.32386 Transcript_21693/m.32386 type:complete len:253 (-) Transcript_21693:853-1611(-)